MWSNIFLRSIKNGILIKPGKVVTILRLIRFSNLAIMATTVGLTYFGIIRYFLDEHLIFPNFTNFHFYVLLLGTVFCAAAGYIINDYYDIKSDKVNHHNDKWDWLSNNKPFALILYFLFLGSGLSIFFYEVVIHDSLLAFPIVIMGNLVLWLYSRYLQHIPLLGNIAIGLLCASIIMMCWVIEFESMRLAPRADFIAISKQVLIFSFFSFLVTFIREIVKDIEDMKGDKVINSKTFPLVSGVSSSKKLIFFLNCLLIIAIPIWLHSSSMPILLSTLLIIPVIWSIFLIYKGQSQDDFHNISILYKVEMVLGLIALWLM